MLHPDDLDQIVEDLRKLGIEACHEFVYGPRGCVEGLDVGEDFFPVWELTLPENQEALARMDFEAIKANRHLKTPVELRARGVAAK